MEDARWLRNACVCDELKFIYSSCPISTSPWLYFHLFFMSRIYFPMIIVSYIYFLSISISLFYVPHLVSLVFLTFMYVIFWEFWVLWRVLNLINLILFYRPFHNTLPISCVCMHGLSEKNYEIGVTLNFQVWHFCFTITDKIDSDKSNLQFVAKCNLRQFDSHYGFVEAILNSRNRIAHINEFQVEPTCNLEV